MNKKVKMDESAFISRANLVAEKTRPTETRRQDSEPAEKKRLEIERVVNGYSTRKNPIVD